MARLTAAIAASVLLGGAHLIFCSPTPVEKGDPTIFYGPNDFSAIYGWSNLGKCSTLYPTWSGCMMATDNSTWTATTYSRFPENAEYIWEVDDTTTANCLIKLHSTQNIACISVPGSECEAKAGTSKILNSRSSGRLSRNSSDSLQAASQALIGLRVNCDAGNTDDIADGVYLNNIDRSKMESSHGGNSQGHVSIHFGGSESC